MKLKGREHTVAGKSVGANLCRDTMVRYLRFGKDIRGPVVILHFSVGETEA